MLGASLRSDPGRDAAGSASAAESMELSGMPMENFPPVMGNNDSKTLRKLSLLEARMIGAGSESRDGGSLPPNDGSRGSENNSNSM